MCRNLDGSFERQPPYEGGVRRRSGASGSERAEAAGRKGGSVEVGRTITVIMCAASFSGGQPQRKKPRGEQLAH